MAKRHNHYEAAFEAFLREHAIPYISVDETKRSLVEGGSLKNVDFLVSPPDQQRLIIDVKGRFFPSGRRKYYWKNWTTLEDLASLSEWEQLLGREFQALIVFAYLVIDDQAPLPLDLLFSYRQQLYGFLAVPASRYALSAQTLSPKWKTVGLSALKLKQLAQPIHDFVLSDSLSSMGN